MHPDQRAALDNNRAQTFAHIEALPPSVRVAVKSMRLALTVGHVLRDIAGATFADRLGEYAAEARAYVFAAWFYNEITDDEKNTLEAYIGAKVNERREVLAAEAEYLARPAQ